MDITRRQFNAALARDFRPMTGAEQRRPMKSIAADRKVSMAEFFRGHEDA